MPGLDALLAAHEVVLTFDHCLMEPRLALSINDMAFTDPALSECGRFTVDPQTTYGLDPQKLEAFNALGTLLKDAVQIALDAGCAHIQQHLGIKTGDTAGAFFSSGTALNAVTQALGDYLVLEIREKIQR